MKPIKWVVVANIGTETGENLHRELEFLAEQEADSWILVNPQYEKIPCYRG